jgi:cytochrome c oxidase cbb3-type subunit III
MKQADKAKSKHDGGAPEVGTTGHVWDGIEELNNPLPRWWVWIFVATTVWGIIYTIAYPAWPLLGSATKGWLGWSSRGEVAAEIAAVETANAGLQTRLAAADPATLASDPELHAFAVNQGAAVFRANCVQCHGAGAAGVQASGFPNLLDDEWLWGGRMEDIVFTVTHGIRNTASPDARYSEMPVFEGMLPPEDIEAVVQHVLAISGQDHDAAQAGRGVTVFADNCAACHGEAGEGNRDLGAPSLTDAIWLYGGDHDRLVATVTRAPFGVMPAWSRDYFASGLDPAEIKAVAAYVHGLGGGE